jgi:hypothetical protein
MQTSVMGFLTFFATSEWQLSILLQCYSSCYACTAVHAQLFMHIGTLLFHKRAAERKHECYVQLDAYSWCRGVVASSQVGVLACTCRHVVEL